MELVRLVIDGFPGLFENDYIPILREKIRTKQALILKDGNTAIGIMLFSSETGSIDFMGSHPLCRGQGIPRAFLDKVMKELLKGKDISITTFREGDRADTGHRRENQGAWIRGSRVVNRIWVSHPAFYFAKGGQL